MTIHGDTRAPVRRGLVLVLVLVVISMLSLAGFSFADLMLTELEVAGVHGRELQARQSLASGVAYLSALLSLPPEELRDVGRLESNPEAMQGIELFRDENELLTGRVTVLSPVLDEEARASGAVRYGIEDESARLNLQALVQWDKSRKGSGRHALMQLPNMSEQQADAILDWFDEDNVPRDQGAEVDYYAGLEPSYGPTNGPVDVLGELLEVRGVTPELLWGPDTNRNGTVDPREARATSGGRPAAAAPSAAGEGAADLQGWSAYLTLYSAEANVDAAGQPRINLNESDLTKLHGALAQRLDVETADFVVLYRQFGPGSGTTQPQQTKATIDLTKPARFTIADVLALVGAKVDATSGADATPVTVASPMTADDAGRWLANWLDTVTVSKEARIVGRVNVNRAPRAVLLGIPGLEQAKVDAIAAKRRGEADPADVTLRTGAWLVTEGVLTIAEFRAVLPFVTGGGGVFRAQIVAGFDESPLTARAEVVLDATVRPARAVLWQDLQRLGQAYDRATLWGETGSRQDRRRGSS